MTIVADAKQGELTFTVGDADGLVLAVQGRPLDTGRPYVIHLRYDPQPSSPSTANTFSVEPTTRFDDRAVRGRLRSALRELYPGAATLNDAEAVIMAVLDDVEEHRATGRLIPGDLEAATIVQETTRVTFDSEAGDWAVSVGRSTIRIKARVWTADDPGRTVRGFPRGINEIPFDGRPERWGACRRAWQTMAVSESESRSN